ncbi:GDSL-like Lipase/Acylhydrolase family protein [Euphorbia peplus]|nr:GDSL-like Lipase/Acylhydrolase family protein [Euphorbia peplus]
MGFSERFLCTCVCFVVVASVAVLADPVVPALIIFGDSVADVGNNNNLNTIVKANFPPYGRDFVGHKPTGRFCNGKLAVDFTAEYLAFDSYPPAYLSQDAQGMRILNGVNFASAASGYYDGTTRLYNAVSLTQQLNNYKDYQTKIVSMIGQEKAKDMFSAADQFSDNLMTYYSTFVQNLYELGARRIGVTNLPPTGCLPAAITLFGGGSSQCVERLNNDAISFNNKLKTTSESLKSSLPGLKLVTFDIYQPLLDMVMKPSDNGFLEVRRSCCGTGTVETSMLCNTRSLGTCSNATSYMFWDGFHPSEATNKVLAGVLLEQGFDLIS